MNLLLQIRRRATVVWMVLILAGIGQAPPTFGEPLPPSIQPSKVIEDRDQVKWSDGRVTGGGQVEALLFSADSRSVIWERDFVGIRAADVITGNVQMTIKHPPFTNSMAVSSDGKLLARGTNEGNVEMWDAAKGTFLQTIKVTKWSIFALAISSDGRFLASDVGDGTVQLWDIKTSNRLFVLGEKSPKSERMDDMAFSPDNSLLATVSRYGRVDVWATDTGKLEYPLPGEFGEPNRIRFTPDGQSIATTSENEIRFWNFRQGVKAVQVIPLPKSLRIRDWMKEMSGPQAYSGPAWGPKPTGMESIRVLLSPDCTTAASLCLSGKIAVWDLKTAKIKYVLVGKRSTNVVGGGVRVVTFSPSGKMVACGLDNGNVEIWNLK